MKINRLVKFVNNTELGKGNTHETYLLISGGYQVDDIFCDYLENGTFCKKQEVLKQYPIRLTEGREIRIVGLGDYYRENDLNAGDAIVLERIGSTSNHNFIISHIKKQNIIVIQKIGTKGFEVLTNLLGFDMTKELTGRCFYEGKEHSFVLNYTNSTRKRRDSPSVTDFYGLNLVCIENGQNINMLGNIDNNEMIEIIKVDDDYYIKKIKTIFKQEIEW